MIINPIKEKSEQFWDATNGNWRDTVYVTCRHCPYEKGNQCMDTQDMLCIPDENGSPLLLPVSLAESLYDCRIDKSECLYNISNLLFQTLFSRYIAQLRPCNHHCPLLIIYENK